MTRRRREEQRLNPADSRKALLRQRRDQRQRKVLWSVLIPVLVVCGLFLAFGAYHEMWRKPNEPVARVNSEAVTAGLFQTRVAYERYQILNTLQSFSSMASSTDNSFLSQFATNQRTGAGENTLNRMIDEALIRQEAAKRSISVSDDEVTRYLAENDLRSVIETTPTPTPTGEATGGATGEASGEATGESAATGEAAGAETGEPAATGEAVAQATGGSSATGEASGEATPAATGAATGVSVTAGGAEDEAAAGEAVGTPATPTATATLDFDYDRDKEKFEKAFKDYIEPILTQTKVSRGDFINIVRQRVYRERLNSSLGETLPITDKQVKAEYLLFQDQATADEAAKALADGEEWQAVVDRFGPRPTPTDATLGGAASSITGGKAITDTASITDTAAITDTGAIRKPGAIDATGAISPTGALTATEPITNGGAIGATGAISRTGAVTDTSGAVASLPTATAAPSPTPDPYAMELGEPEWYTRDGLKNGLGLTDADADKVLAMEADQSSGALQSSRGFLVLQVLEVDAGRTLDEDELKTRKDGAIDKWIEETRVKAQIDRFPFTDKVPPEPDWFIAQFEKFVPAQAAQPTLDLGALQVSTGQPPAGDGQGGTPAPAPPGSP